MTKQAKKGLALLSIILVILQSLLPTITATASEVKKVEPKQKEDVKQDTKDSPQEYLTIDESGNILYDNEPLEVGKGNDKIPANLDDLMKKGVPQTLTSSRASVGSAAIKYKGQLTSGYYTVGDFTINGKQAFCMEHPKGTPATGQANGGLEPYNNDKIAAVLYWGWGGSKNIFSSSERTVGIVSTSLALSHFYYGDSPGTPPKGYNELVKKGNNKDVPSNQISLNNSHSTVNLAVSFNGTKQKSATATLKGDSNNSITYKVPADITLVNETTGGTATNKSVTIKGGQKFHLEASASVSKTVSSGNLSGKIEAFQPLIVKPTNGLQDLGTWRYYRDPTQVVSFKAVFKAQQGNVEITKKGSDGKLLAGAEYDIKNSSGTVVKHVKTASNGKIKVSGLNIGTYTVIETKAPAGYTLDKTPKILTVKANQTATKTFTNKQVFVQVKVSKQDKTTGTTAQGDATLVGAKYGIYSNAAATTKLDEVTIGSNLSATSKKIAMEGSSRTLYVKETKAPTGYNIDSTIYKVTVSQSNTTSEVFVGNVTSKDKVIEGGFNLLKTADKPLLQGDTVGAGKVQALAGAEFSAKLKSSGKVIQKQVTDKNGKATFSKLPYGTYTVSETKVPEGYKPVADFDVTIKSEGQTMTYELEDKVKESDLKLIKKDKETNKTIPLAGVTFKIKDSSGAYIKQDGKTDFATNKEGVLTLVEPLVYGDYTIEELKAPNGYLLNKEPLKFSVTGKETLITLNYFDMPAKGKVKGQKMKEVIDTDKTTAQKVVYKEVPAEGITFDIIANKDIITYDGTRRAKEGDVVDTVTTDKDGYFESTKALYIPDGNEYKLIETNTPENYIPIEPVIFTIKYKDQLTDIVYVTHDLENMMKKGSFDLLKTANKSLFSGMVNPLLREQPLTLAGAEFTVMSKTRDIVQIGVTDKDGYLQFTDLPYGTYFVSETKVPEGYKAVADFLVEVTEDGQSFHYTLNDEVIESPIKIVKKDLETGEVIPRAGATFKIKDSLGNYVEQWVSEPTLEKVTTFETNADGTLELPQMLPYGKYELEEVQAPDGYLLSSNTVPFEVTKETDQQTIELSFFDAPAMGQIKGHKVKEVIDEANSSSDKVVYKEVPAEGITFDVIATKDIITYDGTLRAKAGEVVDTVTTDKDGYFESTKSLYIPEGNEYKLVETNTPENYIPIEPVIFSLHYKDQSTEIVYETIDVKNHLKRGDVEISKQQFGGSKELEGATLNVKGKDIDVTWVSGKEAHLLNLPEGSYVLTETIPNKGYQLNSKSITFEVKNDAVTHQVIFNKKIEKPIKPTLKQMLPSTGDTRLDIALMGLGILCVAGAFFAIRKMRKATK